MPVFTLTLTFRGGSGQKSHWEEAAEKLRRRGARILNVHSKVATVGEPLMPVNQVTITYEAPREIKYRTRQT